MSNVYFPELDDLPFPVLESKYGILNVGLNKHNNFTNYIWTYVYYDSERGTVRALSSYDLRKLRERVLDNGFDWIITDNRKAIETYKFNNELMKKHSKLNHKERNLKLSRKHNTTGFYRVGKNKGNQYKKGYNWKYRYYANGKPKMIVSSDLHKLKKKVIGKGLDWIVLDESKARKTVESEGINWEDLG